ncbi:MarR family winged helix-turn-helix transcriptional regulator [Nocardia sp. alder85J]|uniref:MarR family winged helix-turn-helix transcriptional regulator n=1 Tax=Nocardia sp. alder85J TaxID=2862949 RepID=UPI001CD4C483|nr:MarR family transcriptional regulator [Nocardia sp. alder85J]MCX4098159.1 MarR family transcriptional regulator [Nocardia sp. alder85J]
MGEGNTRASDTEPDTSERELCGLVNAMARQIEAHVRDHAGTLGLTAAQAVALRELNGPMTMRELADRMSCEPSNATFVVDRLEEKNLVERRPSPRDRRTKQLELTADGLALRAKLLALLVQDSPLQLLSHDEQLTLYRLLQRAVTGPRAGARPQ